MVVADDRPVVGSMVRSALQRHPHFEVVGEAENGADAIEEVKRVRPDAIVLNVTMPLINGFQAAREIRSRSQKPQLSFCRRMRTSTLLRKP
jgi:two-component system chemotaxis response regulator CheY